MPQLAQVTPSEGPVPLPSALVYGTVSWTAVGLAEDTSSDLDAYPDARQINGSATFTAQPSKIVKSGPGAVTVLPLPLTYQIIQGRLADQEGRTLISLVGNDSPGTTPQGWSYHVDWQLTDGVTFGAFDFTLAGDEHVDLSDVQPLETPAPGVVITKGEPGVPGSQYPMVVHGDDPNVARPVTDLPVVWFGTVDPLNADDTKDITIPLGDAGEGFEVAASDASVAALIADTASATGGALRSALGVVQVPASASLAAIQAALDTVAPGGTVRLAPGATYTINGTVYVRSGTILDGNGAMIVAANNAAFDTTIDTGDDAVRPRRPRTLLAILGTPATRLTDVRVRNLTIDGNGANQPANGAFANILVAYADGTVLDNVTSINSGTNVTPLAGIDEGICLLLEFCDRTEVRGGRYWNAGYDAIRVAGYATNTKLIGGTSGNAARGSIQVTPLSSSTHIIGWTLDNRLRANTFSYGLFGHNAWDVTMTGGVIYNTTGPCVQFFGDGDVNRNTQSRRIRLVGVQIVATDALAVVVEAPYVREFQMSDCTIRLLGTTNWGITVRGTTGTRAPVSDVVFSNLKIMSDRANSVVWRITDCQGVEVRNCNADAPAMVTHYAYVENVADLIFDGGKIIQTTTSQSIGLYLVNSTRVRWRRMIPTVLWPVRVKNDSSDVDIIDCDLTQTPGTNRLNLYGPVSGRVRGNLGAQTEANGVATVGAAATSITVTHNLWPGTEETGTTATGYTKRRWAAQDFQLTPTGDIGSATKFWVANVTMTTFDIATNVAPGGSGATFAWSANMSRST